MQRNMSFSIHLLILLILPAVTETPSGAQTPVAPGGVEALAEAYPVRLELRLRLKGKAALAAKDITFSTYPGGRRVAYCYTGVGNPKTIQYLHKLGFRTTLYVGAKTSPERIKALEDAGAEIGMAQGFGYGSPHRAVQVNYDIATADWDGHVRLPNSLSHSAGFNVMFPDAHASLHADKDAETMIHYANLQWALVGIAMGDNFRDNIHSLVLYGELR